MRNSAMCALFSVAINKYPGKKVDGFHSGLPFQFQHGFGAEPARSKEDRMVLQLHYYATISVEGANHF